MPVRRNRIIRLVGTVGIIKMLECETRHEKFEIALSLCSIAATMVRKYEFLEVVDFG